MKKSKKFLLPFSLVLLLVAASMFYMKGIVSHADTIPSASIKNQLETMYNGKVNDLLLQNDIYGAKLTREESVYAVRVDGKTGKVLSMVLKKPSAQLAAKQEEVASETKDEDKVKGKSSDVKTEVESDQAAADEPKSQPETPEPAPVQPKPQPEPEPKPEPKQQAQPPQQKPQSQSKPAASKPAPQKTVLLTEQQAVQIALRQLKGEIDDVDFVETSEGGYYLVEIEIDVEDGPDQATYQIHAISGKIMSVTWDD